MTPLVSVIMPIFNLRPYLKRSLDSVLHQTYPALQVLVIDDASTDDTTDLIAAYAARDARVEPVYLPLNGGVSAARNAGLTQARGKYVTFFDGDDWALPAHVATLVAAMERGADMAIAPYFLDDTNERSHQPADRLARPLTQSQLLRGLLAPVGTVRGYTWNKMYRRALITAHDLSFNEHVAIMEDALFNVQYVLEGHRFTYTGTPHYHYVMRADSVTQSLGTLGLLPQEIHALWLIQKLIRVRHTEGERAAEDVIKQMGSDL
ncbi:glycosyltransferase family 2 protein [Lacticaseibacillus yichunensis]|uniref:Glycosyltransferase family 2 protein n=1 Tax=Lacticaseibacillus yichunensis TaxID=2486015 RepID=A0ABW4CQ94_9LACO|nr:glycosyltransferase family 2 protein [Lacticaseibacillus yichunensis]